MMNRTGLFFASWAIGGFGLTLALVSPGRLDATSPDNPTANTSLTPTPINGVEMVLALVDIEPSAAPVMIKRDGLPKIELRVKNMTPHSTEVDAGASIRIVSGVNLMSRVGPSQSEIWKEHESFSLAPNESRVIPLATPLVRLSPGSRLVVSLTSGDKSIKPLELFVEGAPTRNAFGAPTTRAAR